MLNISSIKSLCLTDAGARVRDDERVSKACWKVVVFVFDAPVKRLGDDCAGAGGGGGDEGLLAVVVLAVVDCHLNSIPKRIVGGL